MSEKGGKGYSVLNKSGSLKGKDNSAEKSGKGRRVQFSEEGPFEPRISTPKSGGKGGLSKGGKGDNVANGETVSSSKASRQSDPGIDEKLPQNLQCLMDCEAAYALQRIQEQMVSLSRDATIKIPVSFDQGLQYAKRTNKYTDFKSVRCVLEPLADYGLSDCEICMIANVCPETVDEIFAIVPSLKEKRSIISGVLQDSLTKLTKLKQQPM